MCAGATQLSHASTSIVPEGHLLAERLFRLQSQRMLSVFTVWLFGDIVSRVQFDQYHRIYSRFELQGA